MLLSNKTSRHCRIRTMCHGAYTILYDIIILIAVHYFSGDQACNVSCALSTAVNVPWKCHGR